MSSSAPLKVAMISLGCPKNLVDSEKMLAALAEGGCLVNAPIKHADVIVVNTCGFLSAARDESLEVIRQAVRHKTRGRASRVVVAGCLVNRDARRLYEMVEGIDAIVGVDDRDSILSAVTGRRRLSHVHPFAGGIASDAGRFRLTPRHSAYLRISEGCSQKCTFCAIPAIRGPFRSKTASQVLNEARELAGDGAVELNVIGQDTTSYGLDLPGGAARLSRLLKSLAGIDGVRWVRLMYAYPQRFTDALIRTLATVEGVVPYVDLPLQHISDRVLRRMGRRVTRKATETLLTKLRSSVKGLVLRTTLIVGFPGEGEAEFNELLGFVKDFRFDALGVFEYSPEEGTPAARLDGQVSDQVKRERAQAVMLAQQAMAFAASRRKVGRRIEVLVDGTDASGRCVGRYHGQAPDIDGVCILAEPRPAGSFVRGKVAACDGYDLIVQPD